MKDDHYNMCAINNNNNDISLWVGLAHLVGIKFDVLEQRSTRRGTGTDTGVDTGVDNFAILITT